MIETILRACEIVLICVAAFVVGYVLFCAVCATVNKIKKNRLKWCQQALRLFDLTGQLFSATI